MTVNNRTSTGLFDKVRNYTIVQETIDAGIYPYFTTVESSSETKVTISGKRLIMIGSNNYLGLTTHPKVVEAAIKAIEKYGSGCTGSRFLNGNLDIHHELEEKLAEFMKKEAALVFSTGFQTNQGAISTIVQKGDGVFIDREDHASIVDGCRLSFGKVFKFKHNDIDDLDRVLATYGGDLKGRLIVIDGVYSISGEIAILPEIVEVARKHDANVMVDDAHAIGMLGDIGNGTASHFGLIDEVDITMGTFSKSFASLGGYIVGDTDVMSFIKHNSRALIFSAAMPPSAVATVLASLEIIQNEPERQQRLNQVASRMRKEFGLLGFDTGPSETAIIPIKIGSNEQTFTFWKELYENGVYANAIVSPAVPPGEGLMRTSYMATHTDEEMDQVLEVFKKAGKKLGTI